MLFSEVLFLVVRPSRLDAFCWPTFFGFGIGFGIGFSNQSVHYILISLVANVLNYLCC